jgi:hypothetical protein
MERRRHRFRLLAAADRGRKLDRKGALDLAVLGHSE